jgi:hypothetical protein
MNTGFELNQSPSRGFFKNKLRLLVIALFFSLTLLGLFAAKPAAAASTGQLSVNNPSVGLGQHVSLNGSGFLPGEQVAVWLTSPNGDAFSYGRVYAYDGTFSGYTNSWADDALIYPGIWQVTAQGLNSGEQAFSSFTMLHPSLQASASAVGNGMNEITIDAANWYHGERMTLWVTDMAGNVAYVGYAWVYRDGSVIDGKTFDVALAAGTYRLTAYGNTSGVTTVSTFTAS